MNKSIKKCLTLSVSTCLLIMLAILPWSKALAAEAPAPSTIRILYIGNSMIYFADMPGKIQAILQSLGYTVEFQQVTPGGSWLTEHAQAGSAARKALMDGYNGNRWNYVIVNGNTMEPAGNYNTFLAAAQTLKADTDIYNPGAKFILHSSNPFSPGMVSANSGGVYTDTNKMADDVTNKYARLAADLGVKYGPNTEGMRKLYNDGLKSPSVIWNADGRHHTEFSHYMAAAIYAAMISGVDPNYFTQNCGLSQADADYAKSVAKYVINQSNQGIILGYSSGSVKMEAEDMALTNYTIESNTSAGNGSLIKVNANTTGTASGSFPGTSGTYDVKVTYWDESDGNSKYNLYINNQLIANWVANDASGSVHCNETTKRTKTISNVNINRNDTIKMTGNYDGDEYARIDVIEFIPKNVTSTPPATNPTPTPVNLVNPGFETGNLNGWTEWHSGAVSQAVDKDNPMNGTYKLTHWASTAYQQLTYQHIAVPNGTYTASVWVRSGGGQNILRLFARNYGGAELSAEIGSGPVVNYTKYTIDNIPVTNGQIEIGIWDDAKANNWAVFDNFELMKK